MTDINQISAEALKALMDNLTQAKAFAIEQAPDVLQQMIAWQITSGIIAVLVFIVFAALFFVCLRRAINTSEDVLWSILAVIAGILAFIFAIAASVEGTQAVKAYVAPKVFLLEKIAGMVK